MALLGAVIVAAVLLVAVLAPLLAPYDPAQISIPHRLEAPGAHHWLGTDQLGRDTLSRVLVGTRTAMTVALSSIGGAMAAGIALGLLAGYGPKPVDLGLLLLLDTVNTVPVIIFALALLTLTGPSLAAVIGVIGFFSVPGYARLVRAETLRLKSADFILAERVMGARLPRLLVLHMMPNVIGPLLVVVMMDVPSVIGLEAGLSFLGIGIQPPTPSWGTLLNDGFSFVRQAPFLVLVAGVPVVLATLGFTFLGEFLRDHWNPAARGGR
jgi:peptide/nickel transport system permease protein